MGRGGVFGFESFLVLGRVVGRSFNREKFKVGLPGKME